MNRRAFTLRPSIVIVATGIDRSFTIAVTSCIAITIKDITMIGTSSRNTVTVATTMTMKC